MADIMQWNIRGYRGNFEDLKAVLMRNKGPACVCLQETFHGDRTPLPPSRYTIVPGPTATNQPALTSRPSRGLLTLVKSSIPFYQINVNSDLEALAIRINIGKEYTVCNIYVSPSEPVTTQQIINLVDQLPTPFILLGDLNARSDLWGDTVTNNHGHVIENLLANANICLLNDGSPTHFHVQTNTESCIDLTLISPDILCDLSWIVGDDSHSSDHYPIFLKQNTPTPYTPITTYNFDKADWGLFRRHTIVPNSDFNSDLEIDRRIENFYNLLENAAKVAVPLKNSAEKYPVPWWNAVCSSVQSERKAAKRRYKRTGAIADKIALNRASAIARRTYRKSRKECWRNYTSTVNSETPTAEIFKKIRKIAGKYNGHSAISLECNGRTTCDQNAVANILGDHFSQMSSNNFYDTEFNRRREESERKSLNFSSNNREDYNNKISSSELKYSLMKCSNSAPGEDGIHYQMLKNLSESATALLLHIFNHIYQLNVFPTLWRKSILIPILKPNKTPIQCISYRPISLTSCVCKLMEKILNARLVHFLESQNLLSPFQFGFRKARSTLEPLTKLQSHIYEAFEQKNHTIAVFFDIQKAYDTAWRYNILRNIHDMGIRGHMANFIQNFLRNRFFKVKVGQNLSQEFCQEQGVPQGSVMSVTLFGIAINNIIQDLPNDINRSLFVDDLTIYCSSPSIQSIERRLQNAINKIVEFTKLTGFKISTEKTVAVHFHKKRRPQPEPVLQIHNVNINFQTEAKFLGMVFDKRLNFRQHIDSLRKKCLRSLNLLKILSKMQWGADRTSLLKIYRATTRSQLDYGCQIYASAPPSYLKRLDAVHNLGIRLSIGAFRSSPILSMMADTGELTLEDRREQMCLQLHNRQQRLPNIQTLNHYGDTFRHQKHSKPFRALVSEISNKIELQSQRILQHKPPEEPYWLLPPNISCTFHLPKSKRSYPPHIVKRLFMEHSRENHVNSTHIFTDGSKSADGTGFGVFSSDYQSSVKINSFSSIFTAELFAIFQALSTLENSKNQSVVIFSDSKSSIQGISNIYSQHPIITKIQSCIIQLSRKNIDLKFCWIPSHVNIQGNEQADRLAGEFRTESLSHKIPHSDISAVIKAKIRESWNQRWQSIYPNENKLRKIKNDTVDWNFSFPRRRHLEVILCRLRIGHTKLTHGHYMERRPSNDCTYCDETPLTIEHIFCECPEYNGHRLVCFGRQQPQLANILGKNISIPNVLAFLQRTQLINKI